MRPPILVQVVALFLLAVPSLGAGMSPAPSDTRAQRLLDQRAVEAVYWNHRLWPEANPSPKPPLEQVLPDEKILERVEDAARKSVALGVLWRRPLTSQQLQEEMDRIASGTKDPAMLRELFAALANDPGRIAAALAAPALADRLARSWYAMDGSFHVGTRRRAEDDAARVMSVEGLRKTTGVYHEVEYVLRRDSRPDPDATPDMPVQVAPQDWKQLLATLAAGFDPAAGPDALTSGRLGALREETDSYTLSGVLSRSSDRIRVATVTWPKRPFEDWWKETRSQFPADPPDISGRFILPAVAADCVNDTWRPMRTEFPYGRSGHSAVWTGSEMILWGGNSQVGLLKTGYRYQPAIDAFTPIRADDTTPAPRSGQVAVWTGTEMVVWGGVVTPQGAPSNTGGRYDPATDTWRPTRADATTLTVRSGFSAVWTGTELFIWGGVGPSGSYLQTGGLYNPVSDTWRPTGAGAGVPEARSGPTAVWSGSEVIVWGGAKQGLTGALHQSVETGGRYDPSTNLWSPIAGGGPRYGHTAVWTGSAMIVWGGGLYHTLNINPGQEELILLNTGASYVPATNTWQPTRADATTPAARQGHTAVWTGTRMIVWGGFISSGNSGGVYNPSNDTWTPTRVDATTPSPRRAHSAIWSGTEMIVWGGNFGTESTITATGGRYDPVTDTWVPTHYEPAVPGASGSPDAPAVWTGAEMVFIGRYPLGRYDPAFDRWSPVALNPPTTTTSGPLVWSGTEVLEYGVSYPGARYNPTTDSWSVMTTNGAPPPRGYATAVWSGHEMIVWGGQSQVFPQFPITGGRYNPSTDTWTPTRADATTPSGRWLHTAVWTGREMVVWGGQSPDSPYQLNTGGRYDPLADTWAPTSVTVGTPAGREDPSAVWSGTEMIVWGGILGGGGGTRTNTGGAYAPQTDHWRPIAVDAATPSARYQHAAQWTGHEMIVWGGDNNSALNTGGRYDPVADAWSPTRDDVTTPIARVNPANVWTGKELLVWGGANNGISGLNTGGGYCACLGPTLTWFRDADGDGHGNAGQSLVSCVPQTGYVTDGTDCDDGNGGAWAAPGEATDLRFTSATDLTWNAPAAPGATALVYDLLRSSDPSDFMAAATCVASGVVGTGAVDPEVPPPGTAYDYLVRAANACPSGEGSLGSRSDGTPRVGRACP